MRSAVVHFVAKNVHFVGKTAKAAMVLIKSERPNWQNADESESVSIDGQEREIWKK